jgi:hypothetical protein
MDGRTFGALLGHVKEVSSLRVFVGHCEYLLQDVVEGEIRLKRYGY